MTLKETTHDGGAEDYQKLILKKGEAVPWEHSFTDGVSGIRSSKHMPTTRAVPKQK